MRVLIALLLTIPIFGCATVTGSGTQTVAVTTVCEGQIVVKSQCALSNDKGKWEVTTPASTEVQKSYGDLDVFCTKDASAGSATFRSKNNTNVWGNVLIGGLIGYAIDAGGGAGFDYPQQLTVVLTPPCPQGKTP